MKYRTLLSEASLIKRSFYFLMEVELKNKKRRTLYCPNLGPLPSDNITGSRIWYRTANRIGEGYLDVVELIELNPPVWVAVNPDYAQILVRESVHQGLVQELQGYRFFHINDMMLHKKPLDLLMKETGEQCYLHIKPIFSADEKGVCYFPETIYEDLAPLQDLVMHKESGHRAMLFYCLQHTGVQCLRPAYRMHPLYSDLLRRAIEIGVEVIAYRIDINLRSLHLDARIPILLSEGLETR